MYSKIDKKDYFYRFFLLNNCFMSSCYECNYRTESSADIRLGDYWGSRYKDDKEGVSMVIAMTIEGDNILEKLETINKVELEKNHCEEYWSVQNPKNPIKPVYYDELIDGFKDDSVELKKLAEEFGKGFELYKTLQKPYSIIRSIIRKRR